MDLGNPVCGLTLINLNNKGGLLEREEGEWRNIGFKIDKKYFGGSSHSVLCKVSLFSSATE